MTDENARRVLFLISSIWPVGKVSEPTLQIWRERLGKFEDYDTAVRAVESLTDICKFWPSLAHVAEAYAAESRANHPALVALTPPAAGVLDMKANLKRLRETRERLKPDGVPF